MLRVIGLVALSHPRFPVFPLGPQLVDDNWPEDDHGGSFLLKQESGSSYPNLVPDLNNYVRHLTLPETGGDCPSIF